MSSYRAFKYDAETDTWTAIGAKRDRKSALKAIGKSGAVVFDCKPRCFLSASKPYTMPRATVERLREFPDNADMTI